MSDVNQAHLEKLEALPEGWADSSVSEIVQMVSANNKKLAQKKYLEEGEFPVIDQGQDFIGGYSNDKDLVIEEEPPFIVFGDHTRVFKFANFQFVPGADGVKIMKPLGVDPKWCFYIFQTIKLPNKGYARHFQYLKEAYVPVPPPEQQKRIVAKIEELFSHIDASIEALKKAKQLLKQYRQSILKAAVTGELTKDLPSRQVGWRSPLFRNISGKRVPETSNRYFAYVLECEDGSLYKGFAKDLYQRIDQHLAGKGAKWTKEHKPVSIIHFEDFDTENEAIEREKYFKSGSGREWLNQIRVEQNKKYEPATQLLERILKERRQKWEHEQLRQFTAKGLPAPKKDRWWLYVLLCNDNSFYIGVTEDMPRRWKEHTSGQGAEYTKKHKPELIIHHEEFKSQKEAYNREKELKTGSGRKWLKREYEKGSLRQAGKMPKDDKWKAKYKEPDLGNDKFYSDIPDEWAEASIDQLAWDVRYGSSSKTNDNEKGVPVLRMGNIADGQLDYTNLKYLPKNHDEFPDLLLDDGDLLFNRTNSAELVGKTAVYHDIGRQASLASYLIRVRVISGVEPDFAAYFINSSCGRNWIKSCVSQNVGQANVNGTKLKALLMPLPSSEEQKEIVRVVEEKMQSSDRLLAELEHQLLKVEKNKQSILASAFCGELNREGA